LIDSLPAGYEHFTIAVVRVLGGVDFLVHPTADTLAAAVANVGSLLQPDALLGLILFADIAAPVNAA
jgi:hypothetical protein